MNTSPDKLQTFLYRLIAILLLMLLLGDLVCQIGHKFLERFPIQNF